MNKEEFIVNIENLGIEFTNKQLQQLEEYYKILVDENKKYNLTAICDEKSVYLKHFYDSLTIYKIIKLNNQTICDIGTGAGFPGMVLKIFFPNLFVTLIESNQKKCNFLNMVINKLGLKNITVINIRAEDYAKDNREKFDIVTSRAVAPLKHLLEYSIPLVKENGYYVAMKSNVEMEMQNIENYYKKLYIELDNKFTFYLPIENSQRTLLLYKKYKKTDIKYPRKYSEIKKKEI